MSEKLPHLINLIVGDWSHDGHSMTETITISCNLDKKETVKAYKKGTKKVGFDLTDDVCSDYEDMSVDPEVIKKMREAGIRVEDFIKQYEDDSSWSFEYDATSFAEVWLQIARLGNPDLEYEINVHDSPNINIGGYGLYD